MVEPDQPPTLLVGRVFNTHRAERESRRKRVEGGPTDGDADHLRPLF